MTDRYNELLDLVRACEDDYRKFHEKENREAGIRLRRTLQQIRHLASEIRKETQETKVKFTPKIIRPKKKPQS